MRRSKWARHVVGTRKSVLSSVARKYFTLPSLVYALDVWHTKVSFYTICQRFFEILDLKLSIIRQNLYCQRLIRAHFFRNNSIWRVLSHHIQENVRHPTSVSQMFYLCHIKYRLLFDVDFDLPFSIQDSSRRTNNLPYLLHRTTRGLSMGYTSGFQPVVLTQKVMPWFPLVVIKLCAPKALAFLDRFPSVPEDLSRRMVI